MKRAGLVVTILVLVGGGVTALVLWLTNPNQSTNTPTGGDQNGSNVSTSTDRVESGEVIIRMQNTKFSPPTITVKKGTKVTWVNDDSIQHNVVASNADNTGGLPTQNSLFGKGGSYSFTFDTVGAFAYHCTPHALQMTGMVVVE